MAATENVRQDSSNVRPQTAPAARPRTAKRSKLPPDPSSTLLQGLFLTVPPGKGGSLKLLPGNTNSPLFGPMGLTHDVSYRLDVSRPVRTALSDAQQRPATVRCHAPLKHEPGQLYDDAEHPEMQFSSRTASYHADLRA